LVKLAVFTQDFAGSVTFQEISFDLLKEGNAEAVVVPKVWIPVRNKAVLGTLRMQSRELASELLAGRMSEAQFRARIERTFPELSYFNTGTSEQLSSDKVSELLLITQYFETLKEIGANSKSNSVFIPHSPADGVRDISAQIRNGIMQGGAPGQMRM